jgi:hypothetical protein
MQVFSGDTIWETFLPVALRYAASGASAVKAVAADGVAAFFRSCRSVPAAAGPGHLPSAARSAPLIGCTHGSGTRRASHAPVCG